MARRTHETTNEPIIETPVETNVETPMVEGNLAVQPEQKPTERFDVEHLKALKTQSERVRYLTNQGLSRSEIVKAYPIHLGRTILYQHVRNILVTPLKTKN